MSPPFRNQKNHKGNYLENIHARAMVLVHDISSEYAFRMYEVLSSYKADKN